MGVAAALVVALAVGGGAYAVLRDRGAALAPSASGDLMARVEQLVERIPHTDYVSPTQAQAKAMHDAYAAIVAGDLGRASALVRPLGYRVQRYTDTATGRALVALYEPNAPNPHQWGLFLHDPNARTHLAVEVAHPVDDRDTPQVGVETFRLAGASDLLVSGSDRDAGPDGTGDMAHTPLSVFESVNEAIVGPGVLVYEPHGFEEAGHTGYGDVVVSNGTFPPDPVARHVADAFRADGFAVCVYDGEDCSALGGTENVQGGAARAAGATFLHIETADELRLSPHDRHLLAQAVAQAVLAR